MAELHQWADANADAYMNGIRMTIENPFATLEAITDSYQKMSDEKGGLYAAGYVGFDVLATLAGGGSAAKAAGSVGKAGKIADAAKVASATSDLAKVEKAADVASDLAKIEKATDALEDAAKAADKLEDTADLAKQAEKSSKISRETTDAVKHVMKPETPVNSSNIQKDFKKYAGKVKDVGGKSGRISNLDDGLNFSNRALEHIGEGGRRVPIQTLQDAIRYGEAMPDPRGSNATMYYTTMYKNEKMYNLEVLYDEITNTVYHFEYARKAMGNLPAIPK